MKILSAINENDDIVRKKYVDDGLASKQPTLISGTNIKTINNESVLGQGNIQLVTEEELNKKQDKLYKLSWEYFISSTMATQVDGYVKNALVDLSIGSPTSSEIQAIINLATSSKKVFLNTNEYVLDKMVAQGDEGTFYTLTYNIEMIQDEQEAEQYELGIERVDSSKSCFFLILSPNQDVPSGYLLILGSNESITNTTWKFAIEEDIEYLSEVAISADYNDLKNIPNDIEHKLSYEFYGQTYYYQFYGVSSINGIVVNIGYNANVVEATLALINQTIEELSQSYVPTLAAIQNIHIPDDVYESPVLIINIHNLGCMTCYINSSTKYVESAIFTNFEQGYSVNFGIDPNNLTVYYSAKKKVGSETIKNIVTCTTAEYNASSKSSDTIYLITD